MQPSRRRQTGSLRGEGKSGGGWEHEGRVGGLPGARRLTRLPRGQPPGPGAGACHWPGAPPRRVLGSQGPRQTRRASPAGWPSTGRPEPFPGRALRMAGAATLGIGAAGEDAAFPFPCLLPVAFPRNTPWSPEVGRGVHPELNPDPPPCSPHRATAPLGTSLGRKPEARPGRSYSLSPERGPRSALPPFYFSLLCPLPPISLQVVEGVSLNHRPL